MCERSLKAAEEIEGVTTRFITLRGKTIKPCLHCDYCKRHGAFCIQKDDMTDLYDHIFWADGYIIGSPVYSMSISGPLQTFFNRWRPIHQVHKGALIGKVGGAITTGGTRHGGQETALLTLLCHYIARGIIVVGGEPGGYLGGSVWSRDRLEAGAREDEVGMETVRGLGRRVAHVTRIVKQGRTTLGLIHDHDK